MRKSARLSRFARSPVERSSTTSTSSPRATSASTTWLPKNPAPPVTRTRNEWPLLFNSAVDELVEEIVDKAGRRCASAGLRVAAAGGFRLKLAFVGGSYRRIARLV